MSDLCLKVKFKLICEHIILIDSVNMFYLQKKKLNSFDLNNNLFFIQKLIIKIQATKIKYFFRYDYLTIILCKH